VLAGDQSVNPQFVGTSMAIAAQYGDAAMYDKLQTQAETATDPYKKTRALGTLADFDDPALVRRTLDYATSGKVRNQDSIGLIAGLMSRPETRRVAWTYVKENWERVKAQATMSSGPRLVGAAGTFCSVADKTDVQQFYATHKMPASDRALTRAVQSIDRCMELRATQGPKLAEWLAGQGGATQAAGR